MSDDLKSELVVSDYNLQPISTEDYSKVLAGTIQSKMNIAIFGRRGSGKTEIAKQCVADIHLDDVHGKHPKEVYINLSVAERTDMGGYPDMFGLKRATETEIAEIKRKRFVDYVLPIFYEAMMEGDQDVVAIFDEVDKADSSIWAPLLEILQFRSINHMALPRLRCCVLTGNLISEGSERPSLPLLDRAEKYLLSADSDSWLRWANQTGKIHPSIRSFLADHPSYLYGSNDGGGNLYAEPSPRSWENASKAIVFGEAHGWSRDLIAMKVSGFVGKEAGLKYIIYFEHYQELLPMIDSLFRGEDVILKYEQLEPTKKIYAAMIASARFAKILDDSLPQKKLDRNFIPAELHYIGHFMSNLVKDETALISLRTQVGLPRIVKWTLDEQPSWNNIMAEITSDVVSS